MTPAPGRRLLWIASLVLAVGSALALGWLRVGRPLYYTDGQWAIRGDLLPRGSTLAWQRPTPEIELPGPVLGRVQPMPDGALLYGRVQPDGTSDLVRFDPLQPALGAVSLVELNSAGQEFAPALGDDGRLFFTSDRSGGAGGLDLWVARVEGRVFTAPRPLAELNTEADESDPAPAPDGGLVFVRRVRDDAATTPATPTLLWRLRPDGSAAPMFGPGAPGTRERDPCFAPDGLALWFVRETADAPPQVLRTWTHRGEFVAPLPHPELTAPGGLRAPAQLATGFALLLLGAGDAPLLYRSEAQELYPWWEGQRGLEQLALITLIGALVCLLLLWLGLRWRQLDIITWCLLASLLIHLLALLLLGRLKLVHRFELPPGDTDRIAVQIVAPESRQASEAPGAFRPSDEVAFAGHEQSLEPERPASEAAAAERARSAPELPQVATAANTPQVAARSTQERIETAEPRQARDAVAQTQPAELDATAPAAPQAQAQFQSADTRPLVVQVPGSGVMTATPERELQALPAPRAERRETALAQAPTAERITAPAADASVVAEAALTAQALPEAVPQASTAAPPRTAPADQSAPTAATPGSLVAAQASSREVPALPSAVPLARADHGVAVPRLRDAAQAVEASVATETAGAPAATEMPQLTAAAAATAPERNEVAASSPSASAPDGELAAPRSTRSPVALAAPEVGRREIAPDAVALREDVAAPAPAVAVDAASSEPSTPQPGVLAAAAPASPAVATPERAAPRSVPLSAAGPVASDLGRLAAAPKPEALPELTLRRRALAPPAGPRATVPIALADPVRPAERASGAASSAPMPAGLALAELQPSSVTPQAAELTPAKPSMLRAPLPESFVTALPRRHAPTDPVAAPELFQNRFGVAKAQAIEKFGGTAETEHAVVMGLRYLASIQNEDGSWGDEGRMERKYGETSVGKSALCLLAFLGAGHVPGGDSEHAGVTARAVQYLLSKQDPDSGHFGRTSSYSHGIATYALAECYGMTKALVLREPLSRALSWIVQQQNRTRDARNRGGWGYFSPVLQPEDRYARSSVTAWMVMALESAKLAGLDVGREPFQLAQQFLLQSFDSRHGYFLYNREPSRLRSSWRTLPASTPASVFALSLLGVPREDYRLRAGLEWTLERAPESYRRFSDDEFVLRGAGNVYFWYYGTLACFLAGGEAWQDWNSKLKDLLPQAQDEDGSFPPIDTYARYAGDDQQDRSYTTAMCVLSLEVYYRYFTPLLVGR